MDSPQDPTLHPSPAQMTSQIEKLETEKLLQSDEIRALKAEARSYQEELRSLNAKIRSLEEQAVQDTPFTDIGTQVRLRYLERHRQRMGKGIGQLGYERIKRGDRAAHRGRPVVDALLCLTGLMTDRDVYAHLYGVSPQTMRRWKDVDEMVELTGFHASLQSEGRLTRDFQGPFERLLEVAKSYSSAAELGAAFGENKALQKLQGELQNCYDASVAASSRERQGSST